jgi:hypothetical protein
MLGKGTVRQHNALVEVGGEHGTGKGHTHTMKDVLPTLSPITTTCFQGYAIAVLRGVGVGYATAVLRVLDGVPE